jgi:hypothetical protein
MGILEKVHVGIASEKRCYQCQRVSRGAAVLVLPISAARPLAMRRASSFLSQTNKSRHARWIADAPGAPLPIADQ